MIGFKLELSGGFTAISKKDSMQSGKFGLWITPEYSWENVDIMGALKYTHDNLSISSKDFGDIGLKILFSNKDFDFSIEAIGRCRNKNHPDSKFDINLDYKIGNNSYITASFGKDFENSIIKSNGNLISILGIDFGLGKDPVVKTIR
jgi:hypothetical protein